MADTWRFVARSGASDTIYGLAVSPDGQLLATASWDSAVRVLDLEAGRTLQTLRGHEGRVYSVAFHPGGRLLASGGTDAMVRVWDAETGEALWSQSGHSSLIYSVAFQPQGELLASGSRDQFLMLWDVAASERLAVGFGCMPHDLVVDETKAPAVIVVSGQPSGVETESGERGMEGLARSLSLDTRARRGETPPGRVPDGPDRPRATRGKPLAGPRAPCATSPYRRKAARPNRPSSAIGLARRCREPVPCARQARCFFGSCDERRD